MIGLSQLLSIGGSTVVIGGVAGGGVIAYQNRNAIFNAFTREAAPSIPNKTKVSEKTEINEEDDEQIEDPDSSSEQQDTQKEPALTKETPESSPEEVESTPSTGNSVLDSTNFVYVAGKFTKNKSPNSSKKLFEGSPQKQNYVCHYEKTDGTTIKNTNCEIYKLSSNTTNKALIELSANIEGNKVKEITNLTDTDNFLIKLSDSFHKQFSNEKQTFSIKEVSESTEAVYEFGSFSELVELTKGEQQFKVDSITSNIFIALVTKAETGLTGPINYEDSYACQIGTEQPITCKFYKFTSTGQTYTKDQLDAVAKITNQNTELEVDKYILIELVGTSKTTAQLQGKLQVFKKGTTDTLVLTGIADQLVIGQLNVEPSSTSSNLFVPKETSGTLTNEAVSVNETAFILTKTTEAFDHVQKTTHNAADYICRVINATKKYDDEDCKVFPFPLNPDVKHFSIDDFEKDEKKVSSYDQLAPTKHQVITLKKGLQDELSKEGSTLSLIRKDRKDTLINNKLFAFSKEYDFTDAASSKTDLKTNLFLARYKDGRPSTSEAITVQDTLTCEIGSPADSQSCKIFKFNPGKKVNNITSTEVTSSTRVSASNNLGGNSYYLIELTNVKKGFDDLKNQKIVIKKTDQVIGNFEFDSLLFGKAQVGALQLPRKEVSFIVKKSSTSPITKPDNPTSYGCKLAVPTTETKSTNIDNYDSECKLMAISRTATDEILTYSSINSLSEKADVAAFKSTDNKFFKLTFDEKLLYNFPQTWTPGQEISIELIASNSKVLYKVKIVQKLEASPSLKGKASYALASAGSSSEISTEITATTTSKCSYEEVSSSSDISKLFDCSLYTTTVNDSQTSSPISDASKLKTTYTPITINTPLTEGHHYVVKLDGEKEYTDLTAKKVIYYFYEETTTGTEPDTTPTKTYKKVDLTINGFIDGEFATSKQLFFVQDPTTNP